MKFIRFTVFVYLIGFYSITAAMADWPKLETVQKAEECEEALKIAEMDFHSKASYLYEFANTPENIKSTLVASAADADLSGGDAVSSDETIFTRIENPEKETAPLYWQTNAKNGFRLALHENNVGWRGNLYTLFSVVDSLRLDEFEKMQKYNLAPDSPISVVVEQTWRPPMILQNPHGYLWVIDVGPPYVFLSDWIVYGPDSKRGMASHCVIHFRPNVEESIDLLPRQVRKLAVLLGQTLGDGNDEGTLQPTARVRTEVMHIWANVALRPWAIVDTAYNTREEVDKNLLKWGRPVKSFYKLYQEIYSQYPTAEQTLEKYYLEKLHKTPEEAKRLASFVLDIAFRSYYAFPKEEINSEAEEINIKIAQ